MITKERLKTVLLEVQPVLALCGAICAENLSQRLIGCLLAVFMTVTKVLLRP